MEYKISSKNGQLDLAKIIRKAKDGDIIYVNSEAMLNLAERAKARMCPLKEISFVFGRVIYS